MDMGIWLNIILPILIIVIIVALYFVWLTSRNLGNAVYTENDKEIKKKNIPKSALIVKFLDEKVHKFYTTLLKALPSDYIVIPNVPIEKLFEVSQRNDLRMKGQYADIVIFSSGYMPLLVIDLFDMSIIDLGTVNKVKNISKDVLRNSGVAVLDIKLSNSYNIDEIRRVIANAINPFNK
jgi:hypothetical protein